MAKTKGCQHKNTTATLEVEGAPEVHAGYYRVREYCSLIELCDDCQAVVDDALCTCAIVYNDIKLKGVPKRDRKITLGKIIALKAEIRDLKLEPI